MLTLKDYSSGRNNNFNIVRLVAASMVLVSHSFTLATGNPETEPFGNQIGLTLGSVAVHIFFVSSGFLVTGSLLARKSVFEFFLARALRIYPALWVSQVVTFTIVGLWFTSLSASDFFGHWVTWHSFLKNCFLLRGVDVELPGAFATVPFSIGGVNSSLWTLPIELGMYLKLGLSWLVLHWIPRHGARLCVALWLAVAVFSNLFDAAIALHLPVPFMQADWALTALFFSGVALKVLERRIPVSGWIAAALALAMVCFMSSRTYFPIAYKLMLPYLVIYLALVPFHGRRRARETADYSYGIYIYAYPVQQSLAALLKHITPVQMLCFSYPTVFALAFLSWHLVEKHALRVKEELARTMRALLGTSVRLPAKAQ
jgi:peptidoglycan/LPS O-acetylase OafA/YrhL